MQSNEIRQKFLDFFEKRGHKIIPSASLVPENDPSVLFNTAGMQPLVPYLLGQEHPMGKRIADVQKCVRTGDLDDIGDNRHFSFFEMMGNWSLGDYFKEDAIKWSYEFLTSKEEGLGLDVKRLYVTIFEGDDNAPFDQESKDIWMSIGIPENRIYALPADDNWWSPGDNGPCGPCSEMFYDMSGGIGDLSKDEFISAVQKEDVIEIWNDVFMEYEKKDGKVIGKLAQKNVDTGAGLERITAVMQGKKTAYDTDLFEGVMNAFRNNPDVKIKNEKTFRIIADHLRTSFFLISDGVKPGNTGQGYVLRRLIRRMVRCMDTLGLNDSTLTSLGIEVVKPYTNPLVYENLVLNSGQIANIIKEEESKFRETLQRALKELDYLCQGLFRSGSFSLEEDLSQKNRINGKELFRIFSSFGAPLELSLEYIEDYKLQKGDSNFLDFNKDNVIKEFNESLLEHQKLSQTASAGMFKGGLANHNEQTIKLHTAHHLLLSALQVVVSPDIKQRGSNITEERLRIDFLCDHKLTDEEKQKVEDWVNEKITQRLNVVRREMPLSEAEKIGAQMEFGAKYPETVSVYFIEDSNGNAISKEFCGGPHVSNTSELGHFKIGKEEAVAQGIRRIKATLEQ